ncbi:hypothetical protein SpCBS45565_g00481 [Spizellomyces sp. 'palustris']|nr:hypothetical protein SpCBS45565_g00481 [Spizellomyces sp. 'palustris']
MASLRRFLLWLGLALLVISPLCVGVSGSIVDEEDSEALAGISFTHEFPKHRFGTIPTGEEVEILITVSNNGELNQTISAISGVLTYPQNSSLIARNLTAYRYRTDVDISEEVTVPFRFIVEVEPMELNLIVFVDMINSAGNIHRAIGYKGIVTVVENDSLFDLQSISIYLIGVGFFVAVGYFVYESFFGGKKTSRAKRVKPVAVVKETDVKPGEPDMEWIPEHLVQQATAAKRQSLRIKKRPTK